MVALFHYRRRVGLETEVGSGRAAHPQLQVCCGEYHCSPPHPQRVEPPLEAGRGDEHEENHGVERLKALQSLCLELHVALVQQNVDAIGKLFYSVLRVNQTMRGLRCVRPDIAKIPGGAKLMLEAWSNTSRTSTSWR